MTCRSAHRLLSRLAIAVCVLAISGNAGAEGKPLWEVGAGVTGLSFPDYRGSDQTRIYFLPIPYFVYRGEFLKADRNGVRGTFFNNDSVELNASLNASFPVDSKDNRARQGMADIKPTVEVGPAVDWTMWRSPDNSRILTLQVPARAAFTVQSSPKFIGWVFTPRLNLDLVNFAGMQGWNVGLLSGPRFSSRQHHAYFYSVAPADARPGRNAYDAGGGYAGTQFLASLSKRFPSWWFGAFARYDSLAGAVFEDSPLVKQRHYAAAGFAVAWIFDESKHMVVDGD
jgi:outer membrane scaffolding protein for murein synthesis (MipA/OmpV family)